MSSEHATDAGAAGEESGDVTVSAFGVDVVIEEAFVTFPWRAGMVRAPVAFAAVFVATTLLAAVGGFGSGSLSRRVGLFGIVVFNAHNVPGATGAVPQFFAPVAKPVVGLPVVGDFLRGLFTVGVGHTDPLAHLGGILGGQTDEIGHINFIERQADTDVPGIVYYLLPVAALVGAGYEFADSYWAETITDSPVEVARFGLAVAVGYVLVLLVGSVLFAVQLTSSLAGVVTVFPDRYLIVVLGFAYPAIFSSLGAGIVYLQRKNG